jgi:hypothetical protein
MKTEPDDFDPHDCIAVVLRGDKLDTFATGAPKNFVQYSIL